MSLPVLIGFAGVLVAAAATGMLAGRCVRQRRGWLVLGAAAALALTVALAAESLGFARGFNSDTFRAVQLLALLLAPLWLAWGLVELAVGSDAARFGMRLVSAALTVVCAVILATDPLSSQPFSKAWPASGTHFQPVSVYALDLAQAVAVIAAVLTVALTAVRRGSSPGGRATPTAALLPSAGLAGLAVLVAAAQRLSLPDPSVYPVLGLLAAALMWFGFSRVSSQAGPAAVRAEANGRGAAGRRAGAAGRTDPERGRSPVGGRRDGFDDGYWPGAGDTAEPAEYATYGDRGSRDRRGYPGGGGYPGAPDGSPGPSGPGRPADGRYPGGPPGQRGPGQPGPDRRDPYRGADSGRPPGDRPQPPAAPPYPMAAGAPMPAGGAAPPAVSAQARPYGRILIFTLLEDRVADFDRLAEQSAEEVRTGEPDTLVYVIHLVPNAPMQRIFYEIYRDRAAFERHENQPYMQRFVAERRSCVLATNVIELQLKYAKVAPLPAPAPVQSPAPSRVPGSPRPVPSLPGVPAGGQRRRPPDQLSQPPPGGPRYGGS